jgi:hypothetical protein
MVKSSLEKELKFKCDTGLISKQKQNNKHKSFESKIGEFTDVFCVANDDKPLAALDFSKKGKQKFRKLNKRLINKVIKYCNLHNVCAIYTDHEYVSYLNTIFYKKKNYKKALQLTQLLSYNYTDLIESNPKFSLHVSIGLLLGYSIKNIKYFEKTKNQNIVTTKDIKKMKRDLNKLNYTLEDMKYSIIIDPIPSI